MLAHRGFSDMWAYLGVEPVPVHPEIGGGIPQTYHTRQQDDIPARSAVWLVVVPLGRSDIARLMVDIHQIIEVICGAAYL